MMMPTVSWTTGLINYRYFFTLHTLIYTSYPQIYSNHRAIGAPKLWCDQKKMWYTIPQIFTNKNLSGKFPPFPRVQNTHPHISELLFHLHIIFSIHKHSHINWKSRSDVNRFWFLFFQNKVSLRNTLSWCHWQKQYHIFTTF